MHHDGRMVGAGRQPDAAPLSSHQPGHGVMHTAETAGVRSRPGPVQARVGPAHPARRLGTPAAPAAPTCIQGPSGDCVLHNRIVRRRAG